MLVWRLLCGFLVLLLGPWSAAHAAGIDLRSSTCVATSPGLAIPSPAALAGLRFACKGQPSPAGGRDGWTWLRVDGVSALRALPPGWQLLVDQTRFDRIAIIAVSADGDSQRIVRGAEDLARNWSPGGLLRFTVDAPGADLTALYIGFSRLDDLRLMRKVTAATPRQAAHDDARWLLLIGLFVGALLSAFAYNLLIYTGQRYAFQCWYLIWAASTLVYGLTWTNAAAYLLPGFVGPWAVRANFVLVGIMIGAGNMFLLSVLETGMLPRWLRRTGIGLAIAGLVLGLLASADHLLPAGRTDRWMNYAVLGGAMSAATCLAYAIRRGSRTVWFYMAGWMPVICVFLLRLGRNFGWLPKSDLVDMATFASIALESMVLSLAIADRFRLLRHERDCAEQAAHATAVESDTLRRAAHKDFLTGLGNRAAFQIGLQALVERTAASGFKLFLIDVDHLKAVNDRLGHDGGDALIRHVGACLAAAAGPEGQVSRIGGDEFAVLLPLDRPERAQQVDRALDGIQDAEWNHAGRTWWLSLSIGTARFPCDATDIDTLYKNADLALYRAKRAGRQQRHAYDPSLRAMIDRDAAFIRDAHAGLERGEFSLHYQPIVDLGSGRMIGHEALLRWQHPDHGLLTPAIFGDILAEGRMGEQLQEHVLTLAIAALQDRPHAATFLSVNFTAAQLRGTAAAQRLIDKLRAARIPPEALCIELTEGIVLGLPAEDVTSALHLLHEAGVRIALDDFGTGYASLIHLKQIPVDTLKIDRSFVFGLLEDGGQSEAIVRAIIGLGTGLHKTVVAEGVETEAQRLRLRELGCEFGQGYLFARPLPLLADAPVMDRASLMGLRSA
ncbi:EAL domain-containing protein [uncultured Sphingomonas sp.]|uniref:putative bifunctional diguanylate cyclase/phosphodiesterase n=1 Tax=uncultured Sphingomonas sp. TaxID=158754 RepID=UPI0025CCAE0A|nr:EAL domain-containing protein [uncultured Sphingomonas sp.]